MEKCDVSDKKTEGGRPARFEKRGAQLHEPMNQMIMLTQCLWRTDTNTLMT